MSPLALHVLLQAGVLVISPPAPTVGDTITVTRTMDIPAEARVRAQPLGSSLLIEPLADPMVSRAARGVVIRYTADRIAVEGNVVTVDAGAVLQDLVDFSIDHSLAGIHTMTGIPGWVGGAYCVGGGFWAFWAGWYKRFHGP